MTRKTRIALSWAPAVAYMALIWVLSSISSPISVDDVPFKDKGAHALEYAVLSALLLHALLGTFPTKRVLSMMLGAIGLATLWGLLDEIHQAYVPGRVADVRDLAADAIGAVIGSLVYWVGMSARHRRAHR